VLTNIRNLLESFDIPRVKLPEEVKDAVEGEKEKPKTEKTQTKTHTVTTPTANGGTRTVTQTSDVNTTSGGTTTGIDAATDAQNRLQAEMRETQ